MWRLDRARGPERREWYYADRALDEDMKAFDALLVSEGAPRPLASTDTERDPDGVIARRLEAYRARFEQLSSGEAHSFSARLKFVPFEKDHPDWPALYGLLVAQQVAESYEDGDGDETYLPDGADELIEQWRRRRTEKERAAKEREIVRTAERHATARAYAVSASFAEGETIEHPKFGRGVVLAAGDKLRVRFADGDRQLAYVKPAPAPVAVPTPSPPTPPPSPQGAPLPVVRRVAPDPLIGLSAEERDVVLAERETKAKELAKAAKKRPT